MGKDLALRGTMARVNDGGEEGDAGEERGNGDPAADAGAEKGGRQWQGHGIRDGEE